jgi:hypothetical protein
MLLPLLGSVAAVHRTIRFLFLCWNYFFSRLTLQREKKEFTLEKKVKISRIWIFSTCFVVDGSLFNLLKTLYRQGQASYRVLNWREV